MRHQLICKVFVNLLFVFSVACVEAADGAGNIPPTKTVDFIIKKWPYTEAKGKSVHDVKIQGVYIGQPLDEAEDALSENGFSKMRQNFFQQVTYEYNGEKKTVPYKEHVSLPVNERGKIIRIVTIELNAFNASPDVAKELTPNREISSTIKMDAPISNQAYIVGFIFRQQSLGGERMEKESLYASVREKFGDPNYSNTKAYISLKSTSTENLFYCDCAMIKKEQVRELLEKCDPDYRDNLQWQIMHPGGPGNVPHVTAFANGTWKDIDEALRLAFAPYMEVSFPRNVLTINVQWPYPKNERDTRAVYNRIKKQEALPEAEVQL